MKIIKLNIFTIYFLIISFFCGLIKKSLIIIIIVLFHELGHILFLKIFRIKIRKIIIYPFGGITYVDKDINYPINKELLISCGVILFQIILFIIIYFLPINILTKDIFYKYNIIILLFNILPIMPLDGSIILNSIFNKYLSFKKSYYLKIIISIIFLIILIQFNNYYSLNNYLVLVFLMFKIYEGIINYKYINNKFLLERFLNNYSFKKIHNNTKKIDDLKLETYHYFKDKDRIISEKKILSKLFDKNTYFW